MAKTTKKIKEQKESGENPDPDINANSSPQSTAKKACKNAAKKVETAKLGVMMAGANLFELYRNLLPDEASQSWEKVMKAQVTQAPWKDVFRIPHTKTPTKNLTSFS